MFSWWLQKLNENSLKVLKCCLIRNLYSRFVCSGGETSATKLQYVVFFTDMCQIIFFASESPLAAGEGKYNKLHRIQETYITGEPQRLRKEDVSLGIKEKHD